MNDGFCQRFNVSHQSGASLVQHEDDGLARLCQFLDQAALVLRHPQVVQVTRCLGVAVLADAGNDDVSSCGSLDGLCNLRFVLLVVLSVLLVGDALFQHDVFFAVLQAERLVDGVVFL